ncbi:MAG: hypothetical protein NT092_05310 [Bacteroidia bacterium]|nr:hypothetical protein [Bacteroidia bacterium]
MKKITFILSLLVLFAACTTTETKKVSSDSAGLINGSLITAAIRINLWKFQ